jgi:hypothetical protein
MTIATALMICLLIIITLYLIVELLYHQGVGQRLGFGKIHEWGVSEGMEVKANVACAALSVALVAFICERIERRKSRREKKELPEHERLNESEKNQQS